MTQPVPRHLSLMLDLPLAGVTALEFGPARLFIGGERDGRLELVVTGPALDDGVVREALVRGVRLGRFDAEPEFGPFECAALPPETAEIGALLVFDASELRDDTEAAALPGGEVVVIFFGEQEPIPRARLALQRVRDEMPDLGEVDAIPTPTSPEFDDSGGARVERERLGGCAGGGAACVALLGGLVALLLMLVRT